MSDQDPCSFVRDGVGMAHMGHPFALYLSLGVRLSRLIDSGSLLVSPGQRSHRWALPRLAWEGGGPPVHGGTLFPILGHAVVVVEVEGVESGGALAVVVISVDMCCGLTFGISRCRRAATVTFGVEVVSKCNR